MILFLFKLWFTLYATLFIYNLISSAVGLSIGLRKGYVTCLKWLFKRIGQLIEDQSEEEDEVEAEDPDDVFIPSGMVRNRSFRTFKHEFKLTDATDFIINGTEVIMCDDVTERFATSELTSWNLLTRTRTDLAVAGKKINWKIYCCWILSIIVRYSIFIFFRLPISITSFLWLFLTMLMFKSLPQFRYRREMERYCTVLVSRMVAAAFSAVITHHNRENKAKCGGICVANHTSPMDAAMLATDNCFTLVGQKHGGLFGVIEKCCSMSQSHIWFERTEAADRSRVAQRLKDHVQNPNNNPILIFPEGTCINNTGVFMFKKGCFELGATIYPAVIMYDRNLSDPYWNSSRQNLLTYLMMLMTSWAVKCDIYYLEPKNIQENETAIEFAHRVKADICSKGGLVDLDWDGRIKREVENVVQGRQDEERKTYALNLRIRHSSMSTSEDQPPPSEDHPPPSLPETVEDEGIGLEMKTISAGND